MEGRWKGEIAPREHRDDEVVAERVGGEDDDGGVDEHRHQGDGGNHLIVGQL